VNAVRADTPGIGPNPHRGDCADQHFSMFAAMNDISIPAGAHDAFRQNAADLRRVLWLMSPGDRTGRAAHTPERRTRCVESITLRIRGRTDCR
jgi:hypothetical protein